MKACIFVDGENFRFSIMDLFKQEFRPEDYLPKKANWSIFFKYIVKAVQESIGDPILLLRTYWYVVSDIDFWPYNYTNIPDEKLYQILSADINSEKRIAGANDLKTKKSVADEIVKKLSQEEKTMLLRFRGWQEVQNGIAIGHESIEFRRAGSIKYNLFKKKLDKEKAIDVKLAVDLLELQKAYDQDYVPAMQAIKDKGKLAVNVAFSQQNGSLLPGGARRLNIITDKRIIIPYEKCKEILGICSMPLFNRTNNIGINN
jgi:hypothetical protein